MTAKLTAYADTAAYRRTFVDRNRIIKITDRRFHAAWEELRGGRLWITETVAGECVRARNFADLATVRVVPAQICRTEPRGSMTAIDAAQEVWWIDEWQSATGIVGLRRLGAEQRRERDALLRRMVPEHFACADTDEVEQLADARIVAETVTLEEELLLSSNFNRLELDELNRWLRTHGPGTGQRTGRRTEGPIHLVDGYIKECMEQTEAGRTLGLKAVIAGFWPEDRSADEDEIIASAVQATARMGKKGAHLNKTGAYLADRLTDLRWRNWIVQTIDEMRARGGERIQAAERRHPKHMAWKHKHYADNTPELAKRLDEARWRYPDGGIGFTVTEGDGAYTIAWTKGPGEESTLIGTARDAASAAEALIICGLEPESERIETIEALMRRREMQLARERTDEQ